MSQGYLVELKTRLKIHLLCLWLDKVDSLGLFILGSYQNIYPRQNFFAYPNLYVAYLPHGVIDSWRLLLWLSCKCVYLRDSCFDPCILSLNLIELSLNFFHMSSKIFIVVFYCFFSRLQLVVNFRKESNLFSQSFFHSLYFGNTFKHWLICFLQTSLQVLKQELYVLNLSINKKFEFFRVVWNLLLQRTLDLLLVQNNLIVHCGINLLLHQANYFL